MFYEIKELIIFLFGITAVFCQVSNTIDGYGKFNYVQLHYQDTINGGLGKPPLESNDCAVHPVVASFILKTSQSRSQKTYAIKTWSLNGLPYDEWPKKSEFASILHDGMHLSNGKSLSLNEMREYVRNGSAAVLTRAEERQYSSICASDSFVNGNTCVDSFFCSSCRGILNPLLNESKKDFRFYDFYQDGAIIKKDWFDFNVLDDLIKSYKDDNGEALSLFVLSDDTNLHFSFALGYALRKLSNKDVERIHKFSDWGSIRNCEQAVYEIFVDQPKCSRPTPIELGEGVQVVNGKCEDNALRYKECQLECQTGYAPSEGPHQSKLFCLVTNNPIKLEAKYQGKKLICVKKDEKCSKPTNLPIGAFAGAECKSNGISGTTCDLDCEKNYKKISSAQGICKEDETTHEMKYVGQVIECQNVCAIPRDDYGTLGKRVVTLTQDCSYKDTLSMFYI